MAGARKRDKGAIFPERVVPLSSLSKMLLNEINKGFDRRIREAETTREKRQLRLQKRLETRWWIRRIKPDRAAERLAGYTWRSPPP